MCLSQIAQVISVPSAQDEAVVELAGSRRRVSLAPIVLDGGEVRAGDWVTVHSGMAISVLDESEALAVTMLAGGDEAGER